MPKANAKKPTVLFDDNTYYMIPLYDVESNIVNINFSLLHKSLCTQNKQIFDAEYTARKFNTEIQDLKIFIDHLNRKPISSQGIEYIMKDGSAPGLYKVILKYSDGNKIFLVTLYDVSLMPGTYSDDVLKIYETLVPHIILFKRNVLGVHARGKTGGMLPNGFTVGRRIGCITKNK